MGRGAALPRIPTPLGWASAIARPPEPATAHVPRLSGLHLHIVPNSAVVAKTRIWLDKLTTAPRALSHVAGLKGIVLTTMSGCSTGSSSITRSRMCSLTALSFFDSVSGISSFLVVCTHPANHAANTSMPAAASGLSQALKKSAVPRRLSCLRISARATGGTYELSFQGESLTDEAANAPRVFARLLAAWVGAFASLFSEMPSITLE